MYVICDNYSTNWNISWKFQIFADQNKTFFFCIFSESVLGNTFNKQEFYLDIERFLLVSKNDTENYRLLKKIAILGLKNIFFLHLLCFQKKVIKNNEYI